MVKYIRKAMIFLAETLDLLSEHVDDLKYLKVTFLVYKMLNAIQKDTAKSSAYW